MAGYVRVSAEDEAADAVAGKRWSREERPVSAANADDSDDYEYGEEEDDGQGRGDENKEPRPKHRWRAGGALLLQALFAFTLAVVVAAHWRAGDDADTATSNALDAAAAVPSGGHSTSSTSTLTSSVSSGEHESNSDSEPASSDATGSNYDQDQDQDESEDFQDSFWDKDPAEDNAILNDALLTTIPDEAELYSAKAARRAKQILTKLKRGKSVTVAGLGGSVTAGGGDVVLENRYYEVFGRWLDEVTGHRGNVNVINMGHGSRNTIHSAFFFDSFIPPDTDIVLWEFSINDHYGSNRIHNMMLMFLRKVASLENPPLVVMIYLWSRPLNGGHGTLAEAEWESTGQTRVASQEDFVLGHVNVGKLLMRHEHSVRRVMKKFLADDHHPSDVGHHVMANMVINLFQSALTGRLPTRPSLAPRGHVSLDCAFDANDPRERYLIDAFNGTSPAVSQASYTWEIPHLDPVYPAMLVPVLTSQPAIDKAAIIQGPEAFHTAASGKSSRFRIDRHMSIHLPACASGQFLTFDLSKLDKKVRAILPALHGASLDSAKVYIDGAQLSMDRFVDVREWDCAFNFEGLFNTWIPFLETDRQPVRALSFCATRSVLLKHVAIF